MSHSTSHSVESHLHLEVQEYDQMIRKMVIHYDALISEGVELLKSLVPGNAQILDLGGGTGALSEAILQKCPEVTMELLDIDPKMLSEASKRLSPFGSRISIRHGSFFDPLPSVDAVVASLSLHHVRDLTEKKRLYASIFRSLKTGGAFLNLDATICREPKIEKAVFDEWAKHMGNYNISLKEAYSHFDQWAQEDTYYSIYKELTILEQAGFKQPECFWRKGPLSIYGGIKT